ncbi:hypothetical protein [Herbiconiux ginsengi]|uniref:WxL domain surface cell wall-binding n=1 Tax=Herbiconiux ginsengi TaxID=381665 RepID=A0A1H3QJ07_9MICO|nr:hypothetical protein [Herbiconiux ginsengi]SDZ13594.1 hypothetical protein SAMN05216554_2575 [Herbiconiux ginsengi]
MFKKNALRVAMVGVVAGTIIAVSAGAANAAVDPTTGSKGPLYIADANDGSLWPVTTPVPFSQAVIARASDTDLAAVFVGSNDSTGVETFISPRGQETNPSAWLAYAPNDFIQGTKNVSYPSMRLDDNINGSLTAVKAGGNFSVGFAFMKNNYLNVSADGAYFTNITVTPGTGGADPTWEFAVPSTTVPEQPPVGSAEINLQATTIGAVDGTLNLVAPTVGTAKIENPTIVGGLSTSTGTLGEFTVQDTRVVSHPGWTVTTKVDPFVNASDASKVIANTQLGLAPAAAANFTLNPLVTLANPQVAGSANYGGTGAVFAQAGNTSAVPESKFNAALTFVAPANMPAGTYNSKLTLTLTSK